MTHDLLPAQRHASPGVHPVVAAVESARLLRDQLEVMPDVTAADREALKTELAVLQHWLQATKVEAGDYYHAVVDELAHFADQAEILLAGTDLPGVPAPR